MNSRDDERDRLRRELKYAQEELNRLRRIQKAAAPLLDKDLISGRPASIVSEASTVSGESGDEYREGEPVVDQEPGTIYHHSCDHLCTKVLPDLHLTYTLLQHYNMPHCNMNFDNITYNKQSISVDPKGSVIMRLNCI